MKRAIFTLCINNYLPELTKITLPNIAEYARKCGADFHILTEYPFKDWPVTYQKLQIHEKGKDYDQVMHIDADMLIDHSRFWNIFDVIGPKEIACHATYTASVHFACDQYFFRDDRNLGVCSSFMISSKSCHDLWEPFDISFEVAKNGIDRVHGIDDYCFSRNVAKYGLKVAGVVNAENENMLHHLSGSGGDLDTDTQAFLVNQAKMKLKEWGI